MRLPCLLRGEGFKDSTVITFQGLKEEVLCLYTHGGGGNGRRCGEEWRMFQSGLGMVVPSF